MCGFTGYFLKSSFESNSKTILNMLEFQRHRGPDDSGVLGIHTTQKTLEELAVQRPKDFLSAPNLIFGFNRLSILDLSPAGHQPMINQEAQVALMMNGEVYNAFDFKPELETKGYVFKGHSDTEVVLNLYLEFGLEGMLKRLNGMYALAIYDGREEALFLVRDRVGIKPLYVLQESNRISFSSEMKSFKALPKFTFELDESKLSEFLLFRNAINNTLFKNVINITPGTYWKVDSTGNVEVKNYYDIRTEGDIHQNLTKADLAHALKNSVKRQMISDVKLGCQLSGGVDSSLVTAFAAETLNEGALETVSIVFDEKNFSEKKYIDKVAEQYKLKSHQFTLDASAYLDLIDEAIWHFEQPLNHPNTIGIKLLSREAKKHVTVLLSGEGADEALAGYSRFLPTKSSFWSVDSLKKAIKNKRHVLEFLNVWKQKENRYIMQTAFGNFAGAYTLYPKFSISQAMKSRKNVWNSISDSLPKRKRKYELLTYLPDLLMRQDKMSMAHTIENRVPFLDNEMLETALRIPDEHLIQQRNGRWEGKFLLKEICASTFDETFAFRDKMGFGIPLKSFFASEPFQKRWKEELLPGIERRDIFNTTALAQWMSRPQQMTAEQLDAIWLMMGFEIWAKQYLDK
jgi:asparagine synthase (glutamine-hydrolysing)